MKSDTRLIDVSSARQYYTAEEIIKIVYCALREKGYDPVAQFAGYLLTGDPIYITNHRNARALITNIDRFELMHEVTKIYFKYLEG